MKRIQLLYIKPAFDEKLQAPSEERGVTCLLSPHVHLKCVKLSLCLVSVKIREEKVRKPLGEYLHVYMSGESVSQKALLKKKAHSSISHSGDRRQEEGSPSEPWAMKRRWSPVLLSAGENSSHLLSLLLLFLLFCCGQQNRKTYL